MRPDQVAGGPAGSGKECVDPALRRPGDTGGLWRIPARRKKTPMLPLPAPAHCVAIPYNF